MKFKKKDNKTPSRLLNLWAGISFFIPVFIIYAYSYSDHTFIIKGYEVKKLITKKNNLFLKSDSLKSNKNKSDSAKITRTSTDNNSLIKNINTLLPKKQWAISDYKRLNNSIEFSDTIKHRVLLIGDSECGGLCFPLNDYCEQNGHKLLLSLAWNSATVFNFAFSDTINKIILKYKPSYLFIVFGLNELPARDLEQRKKAADQFAKKISGIPYLWIGPANYMNDYGINKVFESAAETDCFFLTNNIASQNG
jgi:hypothetical protein